MDRQVWKQVRRPLALAAGLVLLIAAVLTAAKAADWSVIIQAPVWTIPAMAAALLANLVLTTALFWVITRSFDAQPPVGVKRMFQLTCGSSLLNYLPLRPGLLGRAAYLKREHQLPIAQSMLILAVTMGVGAVVLGASSVAVLVGGDRHGAMMAVFVLIALLLASPLAGPIAQRIMRRPMVMAWTWVPLKVADMLVGGFKLWLAFRVCGVSVRFDQALAMRAAASMVDMLGLTPNGVGLREWVIGMLTSLTSLIEGPIGMTAALFERAVEAVVVTVMGLIGLVQLRSKG
jgi:hypothetical protein